MVTHALFKRLKGGHAMSPDPAGEAWAKSFASRLIALHTPPGTTCRSAFDPERGVVDVRVVWTLPINTFPATMRSQVLFGKFAKLVGNGTG